MASFPSGTVALFYSNTAPTGWTKNTSYDGHGMRVIGSGSPAGGSTTSNTYQNIVCNNTPWTQPFNLSTPATSAPPTTLNTSQAAPHTHYYVTTQNSPPGAAGPGSAGSFYYNNTATTKNTGANGSSQAHSHSLTPATTWPVNSVTTHSLNVQYITVIHASRD